MEAVAENIVQAIAKAAALLSAPALPVGELTDEQADAIQRDSDVRRHLEYYARLPIDQTAIALVKKICSFLAADRTQSELVPMTEEEGSVAHAIGLTGGRQ